ncbi:MAG: 50S ribosomal protein L34e [Nanoarchaeota archaeon]|jgi:ribosomal protein L34E
MKKRIIIRRTPSGRITKLLKSRKRTYFVCAVSGKRLNKPKYTPKEFRNLSKTKKTVSRPFGDRLPKYSRQEIFYRDVLSKLEQ